MNVTLLATILAISFLALGFMHIVAKKSCGFGQVLPINN